MANERIHELPVTRGMYQVRGIVNGIKKQNFYTEKKTKNNKDFRMINFGVEYEHNKTVSMSLNGMPKDKVYFSKKDPSSGKTVTKAVDWKNRLKSDSEDYRLIGVNLGIEKTTDEKGKEVNNKKTLTEFDACKYMSEKMKDDMSVFVKGNLEFSSFTNKNGDVSRRTKFIPSQVSLCRDDIDFEAEDFKANHAFTQTIVFMGIEKDADSGKFLVEAKIVNYNSIESAEFVIEDAKLAGMFKKNLKPFTAIEVHGRIEVENMVEEVSEEDCWGEQNEMFRTSAPTRRYLLITGASPATIDKTTYTEELINDAIRKQNAAKTAEENFNGKSEDASEDDWGTDSETEDDDDPW